MRISVFNLKIFKFILLFLFTALVFKLLVKYYFYKSVITIETIDESLYDFLQKYNAKINVNNEWTINKSILQYSSFVILEKNGLIKIDVLALINKKNISKSSLYNDVKCVIKSKNNFRLYLVQPDDIIDIPFMHDDFFWKFQCLYKIEEKDELLSDLRDLKVAIVFTNEYFSSKKNSIFSNKEELGVEYIQYQQPKFFNSLVPKKKAVGHCVHLVRDLNEARTKKILNWINMQREIGIEEIRLYIFNVTNDVISIIQNYYTSNFVKIIYHGTKLDEVCKKELERYKANPESVLFKKIYNNCSKLHEIQFDTSNDLILNAHERINTNDCFYNFKYEYEYVTNYDFDEIILPRNIKSYKELKCDNSILEVKNHNYNIYDFADKLFNSYGKFITSSISFENVVFLPNNINFENFIVRLDENNNYPTSISFQGNANKSLIYKINSYSQFTYSKSLVENSKLYKCLKYRYKGVLNYSEIDDRFINGIASMINTREGKSIFNTDNTNGLNQHYDSNKRLSIRRKVPLDIGYTCHFRDVIDGFINNQIYPIDYFLVDIEYILFLINLNSF